LIDARDRLRSGVHLLHALLHALLHHRGMHGRRGAGGLSTGRLGGRLGPHPHSGDEQWNGKSA
jgi:hypothetical protein